ncbi:hypothetical protein JOF56_002146 [Kibdelosporangium banguiense]|uniref:Uncharacterized protein n=1 Tax=Kibdelosporangium banguiense TaxID=1365924 RepID=A0ABS4TD59_9PSEU|nr:hypothetical protein [Kibdelosporangium banguiense]
MDTLPDRFQLFREGSPPPRGCSSFALHLSDSGSRMA